MSEQQYLLEMLDIDKQFPGVKALNHAQLRLRPGTVHALMGENGAGKSTLMKCLFGIYTRDAGTVTMNGKPVAFTSPRDALDNGVAMVHQELNQVLRRSVMENVWLGRFPTNKLGLVDSKKMYADTKAVFERLEIDVDPREVIGSLSVSKRQMVEIAKAVSYNAQILVLDEPTSSLTENEVEHLFKIMRRLTAEGVGIIYISHKMDEILRISNEVTIMRDGQWIATREAADLTKAEIIRLMVGREMTNQFPPKNNRIGDVLLDVKNFSGMYEPTCHDVSFQLHRVEVLGVAGLVGSRRTELLNSLFGYFTKSKNMFAVGGNTEAAAVSGVNVAKTIMLVYLMAGVLYGIASFLEAARITAVGANTGLNYETDAISAVVVGGVSFSGGVGTIQGVVIGAVIMQAIVYALQFLGVNPYIQYIIRGLIIILAVSIDVRKYIVKK